MFTNFFGGVGFGVVVVADDGVDGDDDGSGGDVDVVDVGAVDDNMDMQDFGARITAR